MALTTEEIMKIGLDLAKWNEVPYDSAVHVKGENIKKVLISVDIGISELLLSKELGCDAVIAHHPIGVSYVNFHKVFDRHIDYMTESNIPKLTAEQHVAKFKERVELKTQSSIFLNVVSAAKILQIPLVNIHQPCDEYMRNMILDRISRGKQEYVYDILSSLQTIPEFKNSPTQILIPYGDSTNKVSGFKVVIAAGTNGGYAIAKEYFTNGVSTVIYLHIDPGELDKMRKERIDGNLIILGHLAGDSIGLNALATILEKRGIETIRLGLISDNI